MSGEDLQVYMFAALAISGILTHFSTRKVIKYDPNFQMLPSVFLLLLLRSVLYILLFVCVGGIFFGIIRNEHRVKFQEFVQVDFILSAIVFLWLSELLADGLAQFLTRSRGENWTKEIDYFYLLLGALGVVLTSGTSSLVDPPINTPDAVGPIAVSMSLVLRTIKTRAEVNGWNKNVEVPPERSSKD